MNKPAFFLCVLVFTISIPTLMGENKTVDIDETCKHLPHYDQCVWSLKTSTPDLLVDNRGLAISSLMAALDNASATVERIRDKMDNESEPFLQQCLNDCYDNYLDVSQQMESSLATIAFEGPDSDVKALVLAAIADVEACEECLNNHPNNKTFLSSENGDMFKLSSNSLVFIKRLPPLNHTKPKTPAETQQPAQVSNHPTPPTQTQQPGQAADPAVQTTLAGKTATPVQKPAP